MTPEEKKAVETLIKHHAKQIAHRDLELAIAAHLIATAQTFVMHYFHRTTCECERCQWCKAMQRWLEQRPADAPAVTKDYALRTLYGKKN